MNKLLFIFLFSVLSIGLFSEDQTFTKQDLDLSETGSNEQRSLGIGISSQPQEKVSAPPLGYSERDKYKERKPRPPKQAPQPLPGHADWSFEYPNIRNGIIFTTAEFLYWKAYAHIPYAVKYNNNRINGSLQPFHGARIQAVTFKYKPGFRVGLGFYLPNEGWLANFEYTRHYSRDDHSVQGINFINTLVGTQANDGRLLPVWTSTLINASPVVNPLDFHAQERVRYHVLDAILSKAIFSHSSFSLSPYFGLRSSLIRITESILYKGFSGKLLFSPFIKANLLNRFRGLGIKGGLKGEWMLPYGLGIFGNLGISGVWGRFHIKNSESHIFDIDNLTENILVESRFRSNSNKLSSLQTAFQFLLGFDWGTRLAQEKYFLGVQAAYETNIWPDLIQLRKFVLAKLSNNNTDENIINYYRDSLAFQGLTLKARFDF